MAKGSGGGRSSGRGSGASSATRGKSGASIARSSLTVDEKAGVSYAVSSMKKSIAKYGRDNIRVTDHITRLRDDLHYAREAFSRWKDHTDAAGRQYAHNAASRVRTKEEIFRRLRISPE